MKKIPTLFLSDRREPRSYALLPIVRPECAWVTVGEGTATRKFDGTACMIRAGRLYKRYDAKHGKTPPVGFEPCEAAPDPVTGHWPGWLPVDVSDPADVYHAHVEYMARMLSDGTYELCGPKIGGNRERFEDWILVRHGASPLLDAPRGFAELRTYLSRKNIEGIVFHHPDGRMAKIRKKDYGLERMVTA